MKAVTIVLLYLCGFAVALVEVRAEDKGSFEPIHLNDCSGVDEQDIQGVVKAAEDSADDAFRKRFQMSSIDWADCGRSGSIVTFRIERYPSPELLQAWRKYKSAPFHGIDGVIVLRYDLFLKLAQKKKCSVASLLGAALELSLVRAIIGGGQIGLNDDEAMTRIVVGIQPFNNQAVSSVRAMLRLR